jgi:hypothetical protein
MIHESVCEYRVEELEQSVMGEFLENPISGEKVKYQ